MKTVEFTNPNMPNVYVVLTCKNPNIFDSGQMFKAIEMALEYFRIPLEVRMHIKIEHFETYSGSYRYLDAIKCHNIRIKWEGKQNQKFWRTLFHEMTHMKQQHYQESYFLGGNNDNIYVWNPVNDKPRFFNWTDAHKLALSHPMEYIRLPWEFDANKHAFALLKIARQVGFKISEVFIQFHRITLLKSFICNFLMVAMNPIIWIFLYIGSMGWSYYSSGEIDIIRILINIIFFSLICFGWWSNCRRKNTELQVCSITHEFSEAG